MDSSFRFLDFDTSGNTDSYKLLVGDDKTTTTFSERLKTHLVASIAINEYFEDIVENEGADARQFMNLPVELDNSPGDNGHKDGRLKLCQGDCDEDAHCANGLRCFHRQVIEDPNPPGCAGDTKDTYDYCIQDEAEKEWLYPFPNFMKTTKYFSDIDEIKNVINGGVLEVYFIPKIKRFAWYPTLAQPQRHFTRSFLDASIAAIFGGKTSIGQVCSYAQGLKNGDVTTAPGFCCLDAPYEADYWGELVRNILCKAKFTK